METPARITSGKLTPFMIFYLERQDIVKNYLVDFNRGTNRDCRPGDVSRHIAKLWSELDFDSVKGYCLLSNLYAEMVAKHGPASTGRNINNNSTSANSLVGGGHVESRRHTKSTHKKDSRRPKPPISAFMWFSGHHRAMIRSEDPNLSFSEIGRTIGARWKTATVSERRPFEDLAAEDKTRYARELKEYKQWLTQMSGWKERATVAAPDDAATETCTTSEASRAGAGASTLALGTATSIADPAAAVTTTTVRAPLDRTSQAAFVGATDGYVGDHQAAAQGLVAGSSDDTLSMAGTALVGEPRSLSASGAVPTVAPLTLTRKRTAMETTTTPEASWSANPILFSYKQGASSQADTTAAHSPCAKRQRVEETVFPVTVVASESLPPPPKPLDAMISVGSKVGCTAYPSQQTPPCERNGSVTKSGGVVGSACTLERA